ncbi:MAG TPA: hypothetical protein VMS17_32945 [Gemmataceae bacterium]|nr:hypothetical protein [Gemmataceae bacterium]
MPFQPKWRDYQAGDLFYGLADPRWDLVTHLAAQGQIALAYDANNNLTTIVTIDQYDLCSSTHATAYNLTYDAAFIAALNAHKKYKSVVGQDLENKWGNLKNIGGKDQQVEALAIAKRKCKGGLNYIVHHTPYYIHFCLDGLDMASVAGKSYSGPGATDNPVGKSNTDWMNKVRSITGAELRWVYRNHKVPKVQAKIQFWLNNAQCYPPWGPGHPTKWRAAWAAYIPTHMAK